MDSTRFDEFTKVLARSTSRRQALKAIGAALGGALGLGQAGEALAAKCKGPGANCNSPQQCCSLNCSKGICCPSGTTNCGRGTCVNLSSSLTNCGSCGHACAAGQGCCNGTCTDLTKLTDLTGSRQALQAFGGGCSSRNSLRTTLFIKQT